MRSHQAKLLIDGRESADADSVYERLEALGIEATTWAHPPAFSLAEYQSLRGEIPGTYLQHVFVCDRRGQTWLFACAEGADVEPTRLGISLGAWQVSFGTGKQLMRQLGVIPGALSLFAVLNDELRDVRVAIDRSLVDRGPWNLHPLDNGLTLTIEPEDMLRFLEATGHPAELIDLD